MRPGGGSRKDARSSPVAPPKWPVVALVPVVFGMLWLWWDVQSGVPGVLLGGLPGTLLLATGLSNLLWAGDARIFQFMSLGALSGTLLSVPAAFVFEPVSALVLFLGSTMSFVAAGYLSVGQEPVPEETPTPELGLRQSVRAAGDELSMCSIVLTTWPHAVGRQAKRSGRELYRALELFEERGWFDDPAGYHRKPPPPEKTHRRMDRYREWDFEHVSFGSGYDPWPEEPGRDRWLSYGANRTAYARVLQHPGDPRPWLVCLHGIRMGAPGGDFFLYRPEHLHRELGFNLLLPILPLHGPRREGLVGGDRLLSGDVMDLVHAGAQAMWDIRRLTAWLRMPERAAPAVGVLGYSLGGYTAALLASLEKELDAVICINPAVDPSRLFWRNALSLSTRYLKTSGVTEERTAALMRVISPLSLTPQVPRGKRTIFAGVADRVVPASEAASLWRHWNEPRVAWYQGTHRGFLRTEEGRDLVRAALYASGMRAGGDRPEPGPRDSPS